MQDIICSICQEKMAIKMEKSRTCRLFNWLFKTFMRVSWELNVLKFNFECSKNSISTKLLNKRNSATSHVTDRILYTAPNFNIRHAFNI